MIFIYLFILNKKIIIVNFGVNKIFFIDIKLYIKTIEDFDKFFLIKDSNLTMSKTIFNIIGNDYIIDIYVDKIKNNTNEHKLYELIGIDIINSIVL